MVRFLAPLFGVSVSAIEVVFGQENVNKQLHIKAPTRLPPCLPSIDRSLLQVARFSRRKSSTRTLSAITIGYHF